MCVIVVVLYFIIGCIVAHLFVKNEVSEPDSGKFITAVLTWPLVLFFWLLAVAIEYYFGLTDQRKKK